jgi:predicted NAD-dependent protein-ADP-ribosyltransferase YbiA (DUF1768 family)
MVKSKINSTIIYKDDFGINKEDRGIDVDMYQLRILNVECIISLGRIRYDKVELGVLYTPIYLMFEKPDKIIKIGYFEFKAYRIEKLLDEEQNLDPSLLNEPLIFEKTSENNDFDSEYLQNLIDNEEQPMDMEESSDEDSDEDSDEEKPLIDFTCDEDGDDDDDDEEGETEKDMKKNKKNYVKAEGDTWIKTLLHNNNFGIKDVSPNGDCFFLTIEKAFQSKGFNVTVKKLREIVSAKTDKKQFETYEELFQAIKADTDSNEKKIKELTLANKKIMSEYTTVKNKYETEKDGKLKKQHRKKAIKLVSQKKKNDGLIILANSEITSSAENIEEFKFMDGVNNLKKLKEVMKTSVYWADTYAINTIEQHFKIKCIVLSSRVYNTGNWNKNKPEEILQCGDMVPEKIQKDKVFKPKYYIIIDHTGDHYKLITYKHHHIFTFKDIPYDIKNMIVKRCMNATGKSVYNYIPKFAKLIGEEIKLDTQPKTLQEEADEKKEIEEENIIEGEIINEIEIKPTPSPNKVLFNENIVFVFKSNSSDKYPGTLKGKGWTEKLPAEEKTNFMELDKIKNWRRVLSNFYISPFEDKNGTQWQTVEHYFHAHKFMKNNPEFANNFSLKSGSKICRDPALAKTAGGKTGKIKDPDTKKYIQFRSNDIVIEKDFYEPINGGPSKAEIVLEEGQKLKYKNELPKKVLLATRNAKLVHLQTQRSKPSELISFHDTMRIRDELLKQKTK